MKARISPLPILAVLAVGVTTAACFSRHRDDSKTLRPEPASPSRAASSGVIRNDDGPASHPFLTESPLLARSSDAEAEQESESSLNALETGSEATPRRELAAAWAPVPFEQLLNKVQKMTDQPVWAAQEVEAWLVSHPENGAETVLQALRVGHTNDWSVSGVLVEGLVQAGNTSARKAVASILGDVDAYPPTVVIQAAMAAGELGANADPSLKELLLGMIDSPLADDDRQLSDAALTSLARLAKGDVAWQQLIREQLRHWLQSTAAPEQAVKAFQALGQAAVDEPELVEHAAQLTRSSNESIRAAAQGFLVQIGKSEGAGSRALPSRL